jgi:hypothetical protein
VLAGGCRDTPTRVFLQKRLQRLKIKDDVSKKRGKITAEQVVDGREAK